MENKTIVINRNDKNSKFDIYAGNPMKKDPDYYEQLTWRKKMENGEVSTSMAISIRYCGNIL